MMVLVQQKAVLVGNGGTRSEEGDTGFSMMVMGQYGALIVTTWWQWISIRQ